MRIFRAASFLLIFTLLSGGAPSARVFLTLEEALDLVFPDADEIERQSVFLSKAEAERISARARASLDTRLFVLYRGWKGGELLGTAILDTHTLRTKTETTLVLINPEGNVQHVEILAFYEPPDFMPARGWLTTMESAPLADRFWVGRNVPNITGATLTANALVRAVRRVSAVYEHVSTRSADGRAGGSSGDGTVLPEASAKRAGQIKGVAR